MVEKEERRESRKDLVSSACQRAVESTGISVPLKTIGRGNVMEPDFVYHDPIQTDVEPFHLMPDADPQELYLTQQFKEQLRHARFPGDEPTAAVMVAAAVNSLMPKEIAEDRKMASTASRLLAGISASLFNAASLPQEEKELALWRFQQGLKNSHKPGFNPDLWVVYNTAAEKLLGGSEMENYIGPRRKNDSGSQTSRLLEILEQMRTRRRMPEAMKNLTQLLYAGELPSHKVLSTAISKLARELGYDPTFILPLGNAAYAFDPRRHTEGNIAANPDVLKAVLDVSKTSQQRVNALNALYARDGERLLYRGEAQGLPRLIVERPELERARYQRTAEVPDTMIIVDANGMAVEPGHVHDANGEYHKAVLAAEGIAQLVLSKGGRVMPVVRTPDGYAVDAFTGHIDDIERAFVGGSHPTYTLEAMLRVLQEQPAQVVFISNMRTYPPNELIPAGSIVYHINPRDAGKEVVTALKSSGVFVHPLNSDEMPHVVSLGEYRNRGTPERGYVQLR